jgi:FkbM family methyltransferase
MNKHPTGEIGQGRAMPGPLCELLEEPVASVKQRELTALQDLLVTHNNRVVLFGAGGLGRRALMALRSVGIEPLAFADNNSERWGIFLEGCPILSPAQASTLYGSSCLFVITVWNPAHWFGDTFQQLTAMACQHVSSVAPLYWRFSEEFLPFLLNDLPSKVYEEKESVLLTETLWADPLSLAIFRANVCWRATGDASHLPTRPEENSYFPSDIFTIRKEETVIDGGAFDGDTIRQVLDRAGDNFHSIHAIEADPLSYAKLLESLIPLSPDFRNRIHTYHCALSATRVSLRFEATGRDGSKICSEGGVEVAGIPIDELFANTPVTMIKMDIEGAEYDALLGARQTIQRDRPILAICVYHTQNDIWRIPLLIRELVPSYKLYLRAYEGDGFQTVVFAVPPERLLAN